MIEYALLGCFMALIVVAIIPDAATTISGIFSQVASQLSGAAAVGTPPTGSSSGM